MLVLLYFGKINIVILLRFIPLRAAHQLFSFTRYKPIIYNNYLVKIKLQIVFLKMQLLLWGYTKQRTLCSRACFMQKWQIYWKKSFWEFDNRLTATKKWGINSVWHSYITRCTLSYICISSNYCGEDSIKLQDSMINQSKVTISW